MSDWLDRAVAIVCNIDAVLPNERRSFSVGMQAVVVKWRINDRLVVRIDLPVQEGEVEPAFDSLVATVGPKRST